MRGERREGEKLVEGEGGGGGGGVIATNAIF